MSSATGMALFWAIGTSTCGRRMPPRAMPCSSRTTSGGSPANSMQGLPPAAPRPSSSHWCRWCRAASYSGVIEMWLTFGGIGSGVPKSRSYFGARRSIACWETWHVPAASQ